GVGTKREHSLWTPHAPFTLRIAGAFSRGGRASGGGVCASAAGHGRGPAVRPVAATGRGSAARVAGAPSVMAGRVRAALWAGGGWTGSAPRPREHGGGRVVGAGAGLAFRRRVAGAVRAGGGHPGAEPAAGVRGPARRGRRSDPVAPS